MITMKTPNIFDLLSAYCKAQGKWAVCLYLDYEEGRDTPQTFKPTVETDLPLWGDYWKTTDDVAVTAILEADVVFLCDTKEEMQSIYNQVRGQDGLPGNPIPGRFYACTYDPEGEMLTENT